MRPARRLVPLQLRRGEIAHPGVGGQRRQACSESRTCRAATRRRERRPASRSCSARRTRIAAGSIRPTARADPVRPTSWRRSRPNRGRARSRTRAKSSRVVGFDPGVELRLALRVHEAVVERQLAQRGRKRAQCLAPRVGVGPQPGHDRGARDRASADRPAGAGQRSVGIRRGRDLQTLARPLLRPARAASASAAVAGRRPIGSERRSTASVTSRVPVERRQIERRVLFRRTRPQSRRRCAAARRCASDTSVGVMPPSKVTLARIVTVRSSAPHRSRRTRSQNVFVRLSFDTRSSCCARARLIVEDVAHQHLDRVGSLRGVAKDPELQRVHDAGGQCRQRLLRDHVAVAQKFGVLRDVRLLRRDSPMFENTPVISRRSAVAVLAEPLMTLICRSVTEMSLPGQGGAGEAKARTPARKAAIMEAELAHRRALSCLTASRARRTSARPAYGRCAAAVGCTVPPRRSRRRAARSAPPSSPPPASAPASLIFQRPAGYA